ncbi:GntR family transcriptional regulator [Haloechinothrix sp. LS1_15]|uniref:GntR family transcriptional regulator n=1 Tax=Haloechinothrix sp. LS1_15 TaxID=2652248 RepID=UPI0029451ECD|nr:GntR family transcriptional regulator [Haloechinothrix sp. LS1_15]MDV6014279.1 GntR family transcriptional regulator [Haloechinothrix sp. LS1_15]
MPSVERPVPPYLQIAGHIRDQIIHGELHDGESVPSARQITRDWGVAIATATKALNTLRSEGLVRSVPGVGTVVNSRRAVHPYAGARSIAVVRTGRVYPPGHYAKILSAELVPAPEQVADALALEPGAPVVRRKRTTYNDKDEPVSTSVSWLDGSLSSRAPKLLEAERVVSGTYAYVAERTGRQLDREYSQIAAGYASEVAAEQLGVPESSPVLVTRSRFVDTDGGVIEYGESTSLPGHWVFVEIAATQGQR